MENVCQFATYLGQSFELCVSKVLCKFEQRLSDNIFTCAGDNCNLKWRFFMKDRAVFYKGLVMGLLVDVVLQDTLCVVGF